MGTQLKTTPKRAASSTRWVRLEIDSKIWLNSYQKHLCWYSDCISKDTSLQDKKWGSGALPHDDTGTLPHVSRDFVLLF